MGLMISVVCSADSASALSDQLLQCGSFVATSSRTLLSARTPRHALNPARKLPVPGVTFDAEARRILHHLKNGIDDPRNTILITGYQAENTLGRKLVERWPEAPIFGEMMTRRADVQKINELSGQADQADLLAWMKPLVGTSRRVFLVHGEPMQQKALAAAIQERYGIEVIAPALGETHELVK
jgi:hypothetical protein